MDIRQFRVVVRARDFDRTCRFYSETLALPRLQSWDRDGGRGALFAVGTGAIEVHGRPHGVGGGNDERYDAQGPDQKLVVVLLVASAEKAYEQIIFRDRNVPGGLKKDVEGSLAFETHDPDGVRIVFRES